MAVKTKFSDVDKFFRDMQREVLEAMDEVGRKAVSEAKRNGDYQDRTGNLRASNTYRVGLDGLEIVNTAEYASEVESKGYEVCASAALYAQEELRKKFQK